MRQYNNGLIRAAEKGARESAAAMAADCVEAEDVRCAPLLSSKVKACDERAFIEDLAPCGQVCALAEVEFAVKLHFEGAGTCWLRVVRSTWSRDSFYVQSSVTPTGVAVWQFRNGATRTPRLRPGYGWKE